MRPSGSVNFSPHQLDIFPPTLNMSFWAQDIPGSISTFSPAGCGQKSQDRCGHEFDQGGEESDENVGSKEQREGEAGLLNAL